MEFLRELRDLMQNSWDLDQNYGICVGINGICARIKGFDQNYGIGF